MRYCRYQSPQGPRYATVENRPGPDGAPVPFAVAALAPHSEDFHAQAVHRDHRPPPLHPVSLAELERDGLLLAPVAPSKIVCVGRNYRDHAAELGNDVPTEPLIFLKPPSTLLAPGATVLMPAESKRIDFEGELAVIIGTQLTRASVANATDADLLAAVRGYTCLNDVTARDLQKSDPQWTRGKGFDTFCPVGPLVLVPDVSDTFDPASAELTTLVNGVEKQRGNTRDFIFALPTLLRYIARIMTLEPGDLIATGTPAGVAPLAAGEVVEVHIEGLATLRNPFDKSTD